MFRARRKPAELEQVLGADPRALIPQKQRGRVQGYLEAHGT